MSYIGRLIGSFSIDLLILILLFVLAANHLILGLVIDLADTLL